MYLSGTLDSFHHYEEHDDPRQKETEDDPPFGGTGLVNGYGGVEGRSVPEVCRGGRSVAFFDDGTVFDGTVFPREGVLKQKWHLLDVILPQ